MSVSIFKAVSLAIVTSSLVLLSGCSSPQEKAAKSQIELNERKMEIVDNYEKCVEKSTTDEEQAKCEAMLKAAQCL